ncbi:MAG: hypothetical protein ACK5D7_11485, partial [Planctomycetota bacterium]
LPPCDRVGTLFQTVGGVIPCSFLFPCSKFCGRGCRQPIREDSLQRIPDNGIPGGDNYSRL